MKCSIENNANGRKSELREELLNVLKNEQSANDEYARISGPDFKERFGDWEKAFKEPNEEIETGTISPTGEPKLFHKKGTKQHFYVLKDNTKEFIDKEGLRAAFSTENSADIISFLLHQYTVNGKLNSLNEFQKNESNSKNIKEVIAKAINDYKIEVDAINDPEERATYLERIALVELYQEEFREELIFSIQSLGEKIVEVTEEDKGGGLNIMESTLVNPKTSASINTKILLSQVLDKKLSETPNDINIYELNDGTFEIENLEGEIISEAKDKKEAISKSFELSKTKELGYDLKKSEFLNTEAFLPLDTVMKTLWPMLSDMVTTGSKRDVSSAYQKMYGKINEMKAVYPWMEGLLETLDYLEKNDRNKLFEFVQTFSKTKINYYVTEFSESDNTYKILNATSTNSKESIIIDKWGYKFDRKFLGSQSNISIANQAVIDEAINNVSAIQIEHNATLKLAGKDTGLISTVYTNTANELTKQMNTLGIFDVQPEDFNKYILLAGGASKADEAFKQLFLGFNYLKKDVFNKGRSFKSNGESINPFRSASVFKDFAAATAVRDVDTSDSNVLANDNKNYFVFSNPTYVSSKVAEWISDPAELIEMSNRPYNKNSRWAKWLLGTEIYREEKDRLIISLNRLNKFKSGLASSFKSKNKNNGVDNTSISYEDQLNEGVAKLLGAKIIGRKSYFSTITAADKSRRIEFEGLPMFDSGISGTFDNMRVHEKSVNLLLSYFTDEYNRMMQVKQENATLNDNQKVAYYHGPNGNGKKSQLFPEFNHDSKDPAFAELRGLLYNSKGEPHAKDDSIGGLSDSQIVALKRAIRESITLRVQETATELANVNGLDSAIVKAYGNPIALAGDYLMNGIISNVEYTKMFSGDPAFYKSMPDLIKRIPATYSDGLQLALSNSDQLTFNMATVNGVEVSSKYLEKIRESLNDKSIADAYAVSVDANGKTKGGVNVTDAQAWITPRRWRFLKQRLGQWGSQHDVVFAKMMNGKPLDASKGELKLAAQPLKGVYFEINNGVPTYLKYSQAVLIPDVVAGTPMQQLYNKMTQDENGVPYSDKDAHKEIHEIVTFDGVKVGAIGPTSINKEGTTEMLEDFKLNKVELSNKGWKLQQDLPIKSMHETNLGSQIQKTILESLNLSADYVADAKGNTIKGSILLEKIHEAISSLSNIGKEEVSKKLGIINDKITDKSALYSVLIAEFKDRGGNENIIDALEKDFAFDAIPQIRGRVDSILMSVFNKAITKISTEGGSYIQVSPFGLDSVLKSVEDTQQTSEVEKIYKTSRELETSYLKDVGKDIDLSTKENSFEDSKVDRQVFHISKNKIDKFDSKKVGSNTQAPDTSLGLFFSEDYRTIASMRETKEDLLEGKSVLGHNVHKVSINLKNPYVHNGFIDSIVDVQTKEAYDKKRKELEDQGYDGIVYGLAFDGIDQDYGFVVFDPKNTRIEEVVNDKKSLEKNRPSDFGKKSIVTQPTSGVKVVNEVYDKIDDGIYSLNLNYKGKDYSMVIDRDGEITDASYYDQDALRDVDVRPSIFKFSSEDIKNIFLEIEQPKQQANKVEVVSRYKNSDLKANPDKIYVFGDNVQRSGTGGQAQIRNNENAFGIATKLQPNNSEAAFMSDNDLQSNKDVIDSDIAKIKNDGRDLIFPKDGFGTGLSKLEEKAPQTYAYLKQRLQEEFGFNNDSGVVFGKESISDSGIKIVSGDYNFEGLLPPRRGPNGQTLPGQVMIPHSLAMKILKESGVNLNAIKDWKGVFTPKALEIISYRIPNQGMSSNDTLQIVGILPLSMGDSIIGYDGIPVKTGSDFDIDKMFVMAPNLIYNEETGKIDVLNDGNSDYFKKKNNATDEEGASSLNKQLAQNKVIELYNIILQSSFTYDNMMTSIDASYLKDDIVKLFPVPKERNLTFFSPINQLKVKMDYMSGKSGVGITANQLVDHISNQSLNIAVSNHLGFVGLGKTTLMDREKKGKSIATTLSAFLNAYVDIAKDPYISRGNHNEVTANTSFMLIRGGIDTKILNRFIGQPILREYVELVRRKNSITGAPLLHNGRVLSPGEYLMAKKGFKKDLAALGKVGRVSINELQAGITDPSFRENDSIVLQAFLTLETMGQRFSEAVVAAKSDTKGSGGSPIDIILSKNKIFKVVDNGFVLNYMTKFKKGDKKTALGTYEENSLVWVSKVLNNSKILLSGSSDYADILNRASSILGKGSLMVNASLSKEVDGAIYSYLMSSTDLFKDNRTDFKSLFLNLPNEVGDLKINNSENFLIKELEIKKSGGYDFIGINNKDKPVDYQNNIYRGWMDLYRDPNTKKLAVDLVKYAYTQSGFQPNLNQFFTHIPHEILKDNNFNEDVSKMFDKLEVIALSSEFFSQFARHNSGDPSIVPNVKIKFQTAQEENEASAGFIGQKLLDLTDPNYKDPPMFVTRGSMSDPMLYTLVKHPVTGVEDPVTRMALTKDNEPMYIRTFKLGLKAGKNKIFEYSYENKLKSSIVDSNNFKDNPYLRADILKKYNTFVSQLQIQDASYQEDSESYQKDFEDFNEYDSNNLSSEESGANTVDLTPEQIIEIMKKNKDIRDLGCE